MPSTTLEKHYAEHEGFVSDKWDIYLSEYERLFRSLKQTPVTLLEVGIQNGGSLEIWERYFPNASSILGCDINPGCENLAYASDKIHLVIGDINQPQPLEKLFSIAAEFDIVIDDGSHTSSDIIATFCHLFPRLKHGGLYIVEDLHCSYWEAYEGGLHHPRSSMAFFKRLADVLNFEHWGIEHSREKLLQAFCITPALDEAALAEIHSIEFVNSMCILTKRPAASNRLGKRHVVGKTELVCPIKHVHGTDIGVPSQHENRFARGETADDRRTLTLPFSGDLGPLVGLRLDIADGPTAIVLHGMRLVDSGGHEFWQWPGYTKAFARVSGVAFFREGDGEPHTLFPLDDDPQFELVPPLEVLAAIRPGCTLQLDITPCTLASQLPRLFAHIPSLGQASASPAAGFEDIAELLHARLDKKSRLIASQKEQIQRLEKAQEQQHQQLLHAESQLALLKEFLVGSGRVKPL